MAKAEEGVELGLEPRSLRFLTQSSDPPDLKNHLFQDQQPKAQRPQETEARQGSPTIWLFLHSSSSAGCVPCVPIITSLVIFFLLNYSESVSTLETKKPQSILYSLSRRGSQVTAGAVQLWKIFLVGDLGTEGAMD